MIGRVLTRFSETGQQGRVTTSGEDRFSILVEAINCDQCITTKKIFRTLKFQVLLEYGLKLTYRI